MYDLMQGNVLRVASLGGFLIIQMSQSILIKTYTVMQTIQLTGPQWIKSTTRLNQAQEKMRLSRDMANKMYEVAADVTSILFDSKLAFLVSRSIF